MITGQANGVVKIDGFTLSPFKSLELRNHSPDGFAWGYHGSGPAQLALAILLEFADEKFALENYQHFKFDVIARLPMGQAFKLKSNDVKAWIGARR